MISDFERAIIEKAGRGETLTDDELTDLYLAAPIALRLMDQAHAILATIAGGALTDTGAAFLARRHLGI